MWTLQWQALLIDDMFYPDFWQIVQYETRCWNWLKSAHFYGIPARIASIDFHLGKWDTSIWLETLLDIIRISCRFKLCLAEDLCYTDMKRPTLPPGKATMDVIADYLGCLKKAALTKLEEILPGTEQSAPEITTLKAWLSFCHFSKHLLTN